MKDASQPPARRTGTAGAPAPRRTAAAASSAPHADLERVARAALGEWRRARRRVLDRGARRTDVHDWRIATRRLLAAESLCVPAPRRRSGAEVRALEPELRRCFRTAGRIRDIQVGMTLLRACEYQHPVAKSLAAALRRRLPRLRRRLLRRLERLDIERLRRIVRRWSQPTVRRRGERAADDRPARRAAARVARAWQRVERERAALGPRSTPRALHRLRIEVKRSRYMTECLASLPGAIVDPAVARRLATWQQELGAIADLDALAAAVARFARDEPTSALPAARLRRALETRQRRLGGTFLRTSVALR